jgi:hypothetical protein
MVPEKTVAQCCGPGGIVPYLQQWLPEGCREASKHDNNSIIINMLKTFLR